MRQAKYGHLTLPVVFSDIDIYIFKVIPDVGFTYEVVAQCDVPVVKILL